MLVSTSNIKEILKDYQFKRDKKQDELDERIERIYKDYPDIKSVSDEIKRNGLEMTKLVVMNLSMDNQNSSYEDKLKELEIREERLILIKKNLLIKHNIDPKVFELDFDCKKCKDTGFLQNGKKCNCLNQRLIEDAYKNSNMTTLIEKQNFDTFNIDIFPDEEVENVNVRNSMNKIMQEVYNYSTSFPNVSSLSSQSNKDNIIFIGDAGLGKTFLCSCIAREVLNKGYTVVYQTAFNLLENIEKYKFRNEDFSRMTIDNYNRIFSCDLLIIDDLGTEMQNSFTVSEIFNVINSRIINNKKTIISTNMGFKELKNIYTDRVISRILGHYKYYTIIGRDLRFSNLEDSE